MRLIINSKNVSQILELLNAKTDQLLDQILPLQNKLRTLDWKLIKQELVIFQECFAI